MTEKKRKISSSYLWLIITLILLTIVGVFPGYLRGGNWQWSQENQPSNMRLIGRLRSEPILLENWQILERHGIRLSGKTWYWQRMEQNGKQVSLLIQPQPYYKDKPSVEWIDLQGLNVQGSFCLQTISETLSLSPAELEIESTSETIAELISQKDVSRDTLNTILNSLPPSCSRAFSIRNIDNQEVIIPLVDTQDWSTDSQSTITFETNNNTKVTALFERGWNQNNTVAMVNWYAWKDGGHYKPSRWFLRDLQSQIKGDRTGWVAINLRLYINPLEEIKPRQEELKSLAQKVQIQIMEKIN